MTDSGPIVHQVARGEYLFKILRQYGYSEAEAQAAMTLMGKDPRKWGIASGNIHVIYPGDKITLPSRADLGLALQPADGDDAEDVSDAAAQNRAAGAFDKGSMGRLAAILDNFTWDDAQAEASRRLAAPKVVSNPKVDSDDPLARWVEEKARRSESADARPAAAVPTPSPASPAPTPFRPGPSAAFALPPKEEHYIHWWRRNPNFDYWEDTEGFTLCREFRALEPVQWMPMFSCRICTKTCRLCWMLKYLTLSEIWEAIM